MQRRPAGSRLRPRSRHRCPVLRIAPVDPQARTRQAAGPSRPAGRAVARPPQHPRLPLLPLRRLDRADPSDYRPDAPTRTCWNGARLRRTGGQPAERRPLACRWLALLLDREATDRYERRLRARLRYARLRHQAAVEDVDYRAPRGLDRALFQAMIAGRWIEDAQDLIIEGPAGVG